jgi:hypothetical protein
MENSTILELIKNRNSKYAVTNIRLQKESEEIIDEISKTVNIPRDKIRIAIIAQFRFIRDVIRLCNTPDNKDFNIEDYKTIFIRRIGKFTPKPTFIKKHLNKTDEI